MTIVVETVQIEGSQSSLQPPQLHFSIWISYALPSSFPVMMMMMMNIKSMMDAHDGMSVTVVGAKWVSGVPVTKPLSAGGK